MTRNNSGTMLCLNLKKKRQHKFNHKTVQHVARDRGGGGQARRPKQEMNQQSIHLGVRKHGSHHGRCPANSNMLATLLRGGGQASTKLDKRKGTEHGPERLLCVVVVVLLCVVVCCCVVVFLLCCLCVVSLACWLVGFLWCCVAVWLWLWLKLWLAVVVVVVVVVAVAVAAVVGVVVVCWCVVVLLCVAVCCCLVNKVFMSTSSENELTCTR